MCLLVVLRRGVACETVGGLIQGLAARAEAGSWALPGVMCDSPIRGVMACDVSANPLATFTGRQPTVAACVRAG
jgi:hypothetical protein